MMDETINLAPSSPVSSYNEWDPLEEVILGTPLGSHFAAWRGINDYTVPYGEWVIAEAKVGGGGMPYPVEMVDAACKAVYELERILINEGVRVRHVETMDYSKAFHTPAWGVTSGFGSANPRDPFLVIGTEIIETPMADRSRYFEAWAYRQLFKEYFRAGAKWTAAPKPMLTDELFKTVEEMIVDGQQTGFVLTEFEPVFDAADFVRCGRDIFGQLSNATNRFGVEWLQRHIGDGYRIHLVKNNSPEAIHIDTTFMPIAEGKIIYNPEWINPNELPAILKSWDVIPAPQPIPNTDPLKLVSEWISINFLSLDGERIIVAKDQTNLIALLKDHGMKPIPIDFDAYYPFLGSIHCATLDIRRRGELKSYF